MAELGGVAKPGPTQALGEMGNVQLCQGNSNHSCSQIMFIKILDARQLVPQAISCLLDLLLFLVGLSILAMPLFSLVIFEAKEGIEVTQGRG